MSDLAMLLRIEKVRHNITQRELARRAGIPRQTISMVESGTTRRPTLRTLVALMDALELDSRARREWLRAAGYGSLNGQKPVPKLAPQQAPRAGVDLAAVRAHLEAIVEHLAAIEQIVARGDVRGASHER